MKIDVKKACAMDMDSIYMMGFDVWGVESSEEQYLRECQSSSKYKLGEWHCLESSNSLVSSLIVYKNQFKLQDCYAGLGSISTVPDSRGNGFASKLIVECVEKLRADDYAGVYLHSETDSGIYDRLGFRSVSSSEGTVLMFLELKKAAQVLRPTYF